MAGKKRSRAAHDRSDLDVPLLKNESPCAHAVEDAEDQVNQKDLDLQILRAQLKQFDDDTQRLNRARKTDKQKLEELRTENERLACENEELVKQSHERQYQSGQHNVTEGTDVLQTDLE
ncbi:hypothetical protein E4T42_01316 [Aureobasidium subglaciale]|nr:hypothetical protein E4T42_01316 [Aureobasidium subglaciale]